MSSFKKRINKIGMPPGTLIPPSVHAPLKISTLEFSLDKLAEKNNVSLEECLSFLRTPINTWVEVRGLSDLAMIQKLGSLFGLHPLVLEDVISLEQRPKLDDYKDSIFIVLRRLVCDSITSRVGSQQISIVVGKNYVITFQENDTDFFEPIKKRLRKENSTMRKMGPDYLTYAIMDIIVDSSFIVLEQLDQHFEDLEEELIQHPQYEILTKIQKAKRDIILLRKSIWPMREVVGQLRRIDSPLIHESTKFYMHDVYDHTIQAIDTIESLRDLVSNMLEIYISNINQRLNEIIKVLTMVSVIFCPLTFVTGFYGMNFTHLPLLDSRWGMPLIVLVMIVIVILMLRFFRQRQWI